VLEVYVTVDTSELVLPQSKAKRNIMSGEKRQRVAGSVSVGRSPKRLKKNIQTMNFIIHDFAKLKENRDEFLMTPTIRVDGYDWKLKVYPKGEECSSKLGIEYISCYLECVNRENDDEGPFVKFSISFKNKKIKTSRITDFSTKGKGYRNCITCKRVLETCLDEDGTLVISVSLQLAVDKNDDDVWYPEPLQEEPSLVKLYNNSESTSDVSFDVDGTIFYSHKTILSLHAEALFELTKNNKNNNNDDDGSSGNVVSISDMESETFERILEHVYTIKTSPTVKYDDDTATKLLIASDRLGCTTFKLYIESIIVDKLLTASNAATYLLLSDAHSCALLKEAAMQLHESDAPTVMKSTDWSRVVESNRLLEELFKFMGVKCHGDKNNSDVIENLSVSSLRDKLVHVNFDMDGSREMLIERLKEANSKSSSNSSSK